MDLMEGVILCLVIAVVAVTGICIYDEMKPPIEINSTDIGSYVDQKVQVTLHVTEKIDSGTKLDFMIPIMIPHTVSTGKTTSTYYTTIFVPIFENYEVYSTKEGVYLALDDDQVNENQEVCVVGHVRKEEKSNRYAIEVN